jgi:adenine deaminase
MKDFLKRAIAQGCGAEPADLVLKNGSFYDLVSGRVIASDIARLLCPDLSIRICMLSHRWSHRMNLIAVFYPMA